MEAVHLIRKGRVRRVAKHDSLAQGTIHFHLVWRGNLTQASDFALLLGGILLIKDFRNETPRHAAQSSPHENKELTSRILRREVARITEASNFISLKRNHLNRFTARIRHPPATVESGDRKS